MPALGKPHRSANRHDQCPVWAYSVEKLFLFGAGLTDSILATLQEIDRDDGAEAGSAGSVVLRVLD